MRSFLRRRRLRLAVSALFAGLLLNVWAQDGTGPFLIVLAAASAAALVLGTVAWLAGSQVVRHSRREARQIQSGTHPMRELTR